VYDCGSRKGSGILREEIADFREYIRQHCSDKIDLLVLSHLDADHVNQVRLLLSGTVTCKIAVIPYLSALERIYIYGKTDYNDSTDSQDLSAFLGDPATYLLDLGVEKVIILDGDNEGSADNNVKVPPPKPEGQREDSKLDMNVQLKKIENLSSEQSTYLDSLGDNKKSVEFRKSGDSIYVDYFWEFFLHNKPSVPANLDKFKNFVERLYSIEITEAHLTHGQVTAIFGNRELLKILKAQFKQIFGDCNSTGIVLLHGPINHSDAYGAFRTDWEHPYHWGYHPITGVFTLLNGDIYLQDILYPSYIQNNLKDIRVFQVPHHGADPNWQENIVADLDNVQMVINYGKGNQYGHPGPVVKECIARHTPSWNKIKNTQFKAFRYWLETFYP
jgi:hypothetical protein